MSVVINKKKVTVRTISKMKSEKSKIAVLTAYDYFTAQLLDNAGIDILLVGDSAANVIHGYDNTLPITVDVMLNHTSAVARGNKRSMIVADMPFLSYQVSIKSAIQNCGRFLKEGGAEGVKIEGGIEMLPTIKRLIEIGIPVMGHIGLTPQSINRIGGPQVQGREEKSSTYLKESALALEEVGCFSMVLELVKSSLAAEITTSLKHTATIGIGAGPDCDGQVLVTNDILGLKPEGFKPRFLREYADLPPIITEAAKRFIEDIRSGDYPSDKESF